MPGCALSVGWYSAAQDVAVTWNNRFGAKKSASDHDAQELVPFVEGKLGDRSHVLKPAVVDEDRRSSAKFAHGLRQRRRNFFLAGNVATHKRNGSVGRSLNIPAHGRVAEILSERT